MLFKGLQQLKISLVCLNGGSAKAAVLCCHMFFWIDWMCVTADGLVLSLAQFF